MDQHSLLQVWQVRLPHLPAFPGWACKRVAVGWAAERVGSCKASPGTRWRAAGLHATLLFKKQGFLQLTARLPRESPATSSSLPSLLTSATATWACSGRVGQREVLQHWPPWQQQALSPAPPSLGAVEGQLRRCLWACISCARQGGIA